MATDVTECVVSTGYKQWINSENLRSRFWGKVEKGDACWTWKSATWGSGYGFFWVGGSKRSEFAHRVAWVIANGKSIPADAVVMHSCDNKMCVNPSHLSLGSHKDNKQDSVKKLRHAYGERNAGNKLSLQQVIEIRGAKGVNRRKAVAALYGVHEGTVKSIWSRRTWAIATGDDHRT